MRCSSSAIRPSAFNNRWFTGLVPPPDAPTVLQAATHAASDDWPNGDLARSPATRSGAMRGTGRRFDLKKGAFDDSRFTTTNTFAVACRDGSGRRAAADRCSRSRKLPVWADWPGVQSAPAVRQTTNRCFGLPRSACSPSRGCLDRGRSPGCVPFGHPCSACRTDVARRVASGSVTAWEHRPKLSGEFWPHGDGSAGDSAGHFCNGGVF